VRAGNEVEASERLKDAEAIFKALVGDGSETEDFQEDKEERALSWIMYMRFARRAMSVKASREVFMRARKWAECPWQVYVASARMEWECSREEKVARNIFENGLKKFMTLKEYVEAYVEFLLGIGDMVNGRTLYERALQVNFSQPYFPNTHAHAQIVWSFLGRSGL
jgi:cleavage stimulation factor subunit 3